MKLPRYTLREINVMLKAPREKLEGMPTDDGRFGLAELLTTEGEYELWYWRAYNCAEWHCSGHWITEKAFTPTDEPEK